MRASRLLLALASLAFAPPMGAQPRPGWKHWEGRYYTCWIPQDWRVVETLSGIDISEPSGSGVVSFAYATNAPAPTNPEQVRTFTLQTIGVLGVRVLNQGAPFQSGGGLTQVTEFAGTRGGVPVHGVLKATAFNNLGSFGYSGYLRMSNAASWAELSGTLESIEKTILQMRGRPH